MKYVGSSCDVGEMMVEDVEEELDKLSGSALRNMTQDVEKLAQLLQGNVLHVADRGTNGPAATLR